MGNSKSKPVTNPPFISECEIYHGEWGLDDQQRFHACACSKGNKFIPVDNLTMDRLPTEFRSEKFLIGIKSMCNRTVKVKLDYVSSKRPKTYADGTAPYPFAEHRGAEKARCGTGWIRFEPRLVTGEKCPCHKCEHEPLQKRRTGYFGVDVATAVHLVYNKQEAANVVCEVFYDSPGRKDVGYLYGLNGWEWSDDDTKRCGGDWIRLSCVSHDMVLYDRLVSTLNRDYIKADIIPLIVSHPHGVNKQISIGTHRILSITFNRTHTPRKRYVIPADTWVCADMTVMSLYPEFFRKRRYDDTGCYYTTQDLRLFIKSDRSEPITFYFSSDPRDKPSFGYAMYLPNDTTIITSKDGQTQFPVEVFSWRIKDLMKVLEGRMKSLHIKHDIHTCVGSSGAYVNEMSHLPRQAIHAGVELNGMKRTGVYMLSR